MIGLLPYHPDRDNRVCIENSPKGTLPSVPPKCKSYQHRSLSLRLAGKETTIQKNAQSAFASSIDGLASVLALACAFLITPEIDSRTINWALRTFTDTYGTDFLWFFRWGWFALIGAGVFYAARAVLALALMMLSGWAALRFGLLPV